MKNPVLLLTTLLCLTSPVLGQNRFEYSMLLENNAGTYLPNVIYALDTNTNQVVPYSHRIHNALNAILPAGHSVEARSLSLGYDGTDYLDPHGLLGFTLADRTSSASSGGLFDSAVYNESQREVHADLYILGHRPNTAPSTNVKTVEENSAVLPPTGDQFMPTASFRLPGGATGSPIWADPPGIVGLDYHLTSSQGPIWFTVNEPFYLPSFGGTVYPSDILQLDGNGLITRFQRHSDMGLSTGDEIDALSMCYFPTQYSNLDVNWIYSLTPDSAYFASNSTPMTAADPGAAWLFHARDGLPTANPSTWTSAQANGLDQVFASSQQSDIDISGVVSIDPKLFLKGTSWRPDGFGTGTEWDPSQERLTFTSLSTESTVVILWDYSFETLNGANSFQVSREPETRSCFRRSMSTPMASPALTGRCCALPEPATTSWTRSSCSKSATDSSTYTSRIGDPPHSTRPSRFSRTVRRSIRGRTLLPTC